AFQHRPCRRGPMAALIAFVIVGGCSSNYVSRDDVSVPTDVYLADLDSCRSSAAAVQTAAGAEGFLAGALLGAAHGAIIGAHQGGADVGAIVGASVGAVVGFFHGLDWS